MANPTKTASQMTSQEIKATPAPMPAAPAPTTPVMERVKKITAKDFGKIKTGIENGVKISGSLVKIAQKTGPSGEYVAFLGDFRLVSADKILAAGELLLPLAPETLLSGRYTTLSTNDKGVFVKGVNAIFACTMYKVEAKDNPRGYTWAVSEIKKMALPDASNDPLLKLIQG